MKIAIAFVIAFTIIACGPSREQMAGEKFKRAQKLFNNHQFNDAKLVIDSINSDFSDQIEFTTRGNNLLRSITLEEQKANLTFLDSLLLVKENELVPLMKNFVESNEYGAKTILIHKRQKPENSYNRVYIRANLDVDGNFYISSHYTGDSRINHTQIKAYVGDQSALSEMIEIDGFNNRHFDDGGTKWEIIQYKDGKDNGVIDFIAANHDKSVKIQFIGKKHYYIVMEKFDKEAIRDGYEISFVLKEIKRIKDEISKVKAELKRLNN